MFFQVGSIVFGLGLLVGGIAVLAFNLGFLGKRNTNRYEDVARCQYNRLLLVVVGLVVLGGVLMVAGKLLSDHGH